MIFKKRKALLRKIVQLEENVKDWKRMFKSYKKAFHQEISITRELIKKNRYLEKRVTSLEEQNREIQIKANERVREAYSQIGK